MIRDVHAGGLGHLLPTPVTLTGVPDLRVMGA